MPLVIPDEELSALGLSADEARIEIACRLFQAERLTKRQARQLAGLSRLDFEDECIKRNIPVYEVTEESLKSDLEGLKQWERQRQKL